MVINVSVTKARKREKKVGMGKFQGLKRKAESKEGNNGTSNNMRSCKAAVMFSINYFHFHGSPLRYLTSPHTQSSTLAKIS